MRKIDVFIVVVAIMVVSCASLTFADNTNIGIGIENNNTANNITDVDVNQQQKQQQQQAQNQRLENNFVVPIQPYAPNSPQALSPGQAIANGAWLLYVPNVIETLTFEEADSLSEDVQGGFLWWGNRIKVALKVRGLAKTSSIKIVNYEGKRAGDVVVGFSRVFGKKQDITEALIALSGKSGMEFGATGMSIKFRVKNRTNAKGLSIGGGGGVGLPVACNGGVGTGISFGAFISSIAVEDEIELQITYLVVGMESTVYTPLPKPQSQKPTCDRVSIQIRIDDAERRIVRCTTWCFDNMVNRRDAAEANIDMFVCTGELRYLRAAKFHFLKLRDNYLKGGRSIRANQVSADAMMSKAYLDWAISIKTLEGKKTAYKFVSKYNLDMNVEALPTFTK